MTKIKRAALSTLVLAFGLALGACESKLSTPAYPDLTFQHLGTINLNVGALKIVSSYKTPMAAPNVEHLFPASPESTLKRWAADRLIAAGAGATGAYGRFTILDASVREISLEMQKGLKGAFTKDQSERYEAVLEATLEIFDEGTTAQGFASAKASRSITVREDATVNERSQAWFRLNEALIRDINAAFEKNIPLYLSKWLM